MVRASVVVRGLHEITGNSTYILHNVAGGISRNPITLSYCNVYMPYVYNPESARKSLRTLLKREMVGLGKLAMDG